MIYDSNEIMKVLPHRYPFLLVDKIMELEVGVRAKGIKCVSVNEMHFLGHFPTKHVMPGVLIIEALAQVGAFALLSKPELKGKLAYFAGIKEARFKQMVIPGDVLELETTLTKIRGSIGFGHAVAKVNEQVVCQAELIFAIEQ